MALIKKLSLCFSTVRRFTLALVSTAVLAGFVGALAGLIVALIAQSREDKRLRQSEEWRQRAAKQERLRGEFATALKLVYTIAAHTNIFNWVPLSRASKDPVYVKRLAELDALYEEAKSADLRLRLEGATAAWGAIYEVTRQHQAFRDALELRDMPHSAPESYVAATDTMKSSHEAISAVAATLHETLAAELDQLTPPGPPLGLRSWLASAWRWVRT